MTALFITILNMSITASIVALAVMIVRIPLRKAPKIFSYILWSVVLFRLVFSFSIESIFSLMPNSTNVIPQDIVFSQSPTMQTEIQIHNAMPINEGSINPISTFLQIAGFIWIIGFFVLLLYAIIGYIRLKRRVQFATLIRDNIFETDKIKVPFVLGFIHPKIYFPINIDLSQYDYILKHEQTHIKRQDYLIKLFAYILLALHWFNPIIWISYFLMSKDMEMSCDEAVLRNVSEDIRKDYSSTLLNLSIEKNSILSPIAFGESNVKERVTNVLNFKKTKTWIIVVSVVAVALFLVACSLDPINAQNETPLVTTDTSTRNGLVIFADFHYDVTDEEIANVIALISDHPLVYDFEFIDRYEERERAIEQIADGDDRLRGLLESAENRFFDIIEIEVVDIGSIEEVIEFVYALDPIMFVQWLGADTSMRRELEVFFWAEFREDVTDDEIANVIESISDHPLVYAYQFIVRCEGHGRIIEYTVDGVDNLPTLFEEEDIPPNTFVYVILIEVVDIDSREEVFEFISSLEPIVFIHLSVTWEK